MGVPELPIFFDQTGRRWRRVRSVWLALAAAVTLMAAVLILSVFINPLLPHLDLRPSAFLPRSTDLKLQPPTLPITRRERKAKRAEDRLKKALRTTKVVPAKRPQQITPAPPPVSPPQPATGGAKPLSIGFYVNWDDSSYSSLRSNLEGLDWVVPEWVRLQDGPDPLVRDVDPRALDLIRRERPQTVIIPLVQNYREEQWEGELLASSVADEQSRQRLISSLVEFVTENRFGGVAIDLEEVPAASQGNLLSFMQELHAAFKERGLIVAQAVPFDNPDWDYKAYAEATDYLMLMAYDSIGLRVSPGLSQPRTGSTRRWGAACESWLPLRQSSVSAATATTGLVGVGKRRS